MQKLEKSYISNFLKIGFASTAITLMSAYSAVAATLNITFQKLEGLTGGNPAGTAVYYADLSNVDFDINSITIGDSNRGGGTTGAFSGFDLDAIKLSRELVNNATSVNGISGLSVFDFSSNGTALTPGTQRDPVNPGDPAKAVDMFGSTDGIVNNLVATLGSFDGNSTSALQVDSANPSTAFGFVSLGDGGKISFNLTSALSNSSNPLYLYIGEVGDNGEVVNGQIMVSDKPVPVPEPTSIAALSVLGIYIAVRRNQKKKIA
ncbi:MAG: PEP-CTERM sorting domain-containing protein [Scytonema sp. PMC 1069.18]|nr:PEP-CTERM sorting domain-containing protein [Scytonema sp. PMC 1069.18]MEC4886916.1 PEP-CTERM sorting domain-containing protein [Scytonema sp. PMC 1070.18]